MQTSVNESTLGNAASDDEEFTPQWGDNAPKGGRAALNRVLRDGNKAPCGEATAVWVWNALERHRHQGGVESTGAGSNAKPLGPVLGES